MPLTDWFSIFRSGEHTSSSGEKRTFSGDDLDRIIARYEGQTPSPCVITHEELYSPFAYAQERRRRRRAKRWPGYFTRGQGKDCLLWHKHL